MILDKFNLEGKVAIVTGGGTGLGKAMCLALARAGADIMAAARRMGPISETAEEVKALGRRALAISTDITDSAQVNNMVEKTIAELGKVDILVNNAGVAKGIDVMTFDLIRGIPPRPIWEITDDMWHTAMDINLTGAFYCTRAVVKHMIERKQGKIINMASGAALRAIQGNYTYCTAKAGVHLFSHTSALTFAPYNIQVNCLAPAFLIRGGDSYEYVPEEIIKKREGFTVIGRAGRFDEVGGLVVYLASDASNYVTGELFVVDAAGIAGYAPYGYAPFTPVK